MVTVRAVLSMAAMYGWRLHQMDVFNAFFQGDLVEDVYMVQPPGFARQGSCLRVTMYGWRLHQMDVFNAFFQGDLVEDVYMVQPPGFARQGSCLSHYDYSLFTKKLDGHIVIILVYVDDLLITGSSSSLIHATKASLQHHFKIKDLGEMKYFLGLEIARSKDGISVCQRKFALDLILDLGLAGSKPANTPLEVNQRLTSVEYDKGLGAGDTEIDEAMEDATSYQKLVGKLLYLTMARPDIAYTVQNLSQFMLSPKKSHMEAALRVVKYLKNAPGLGILLSSKRSNELIVFCDADWATCPMTRKSISGFVVKIGDSLLSWKSKNRVLYQEFQ
ncbi:PREDICTED: uncharacterized protein LOC109214382 [Nicotiana attenuata]|uniref:uncharacterized protein LOC109214382 n=1 Tax=Nicotiana attenuata TaxID=49451 RepID=UPI000905A45D|nr:PREDICTED: uncharacterized protein LOC109214382 [Nicotiana attenuata]